AFRTRAERRTSASCFPSYQHRLNHARQNAIVLSSRRASSAASGALDGSRLSEEGDQAASIQTSSSALTRQRPWIPSPTHWSGFEALTHMAFAPPTISALRSPVSRKRGTMSPYSKRGATVARTSTVPLRQRSRRRIEWQERTLVGSVGSCGETGMQSVSSSTPWAHAEVVTSTFVSSRYARRGSRPSAGGRPEQPPRPASGRGQEKERGTRRGK